MINFKSFSDQEGFHWLAFGKDGTAYTACSLNRAWEKIQTTSNSVGICATVIKKITFEDSREKVNDKQRFFLISKTKLDSSFPSGQFVIKSYSTPLRLDRNQNGGGFLLYVREDIPWKVLKEYTPEKPKENLFVEINLRSRNWLLSCSYNHKTNLIADHLYCIGRGIDFQFFKVW